MFKLCTVNFNYLKITLTFTKDCFDNSLSKRWIKHSYNSWFIHYITCFNAEIWEKNSKQFISGKSNRNGLFFIWPFPLWTMKSARFFFRWIFVCFSYTIFREGPYYFRYFMTLELAGGHILTWKMFGYFFSVFLSQKSFYSKAQK